jgi:hypothetical protein
MGVHVPLLAASRRSARPVPRGLVTLRQLGALGIAAGVVQLAPSAAAGPQAIVALLVVWAYAMLMRVECFAPRWLRAHDRHVRTARTAGNVRFNIDRSLQAMKLSHLYLASLALMASAVGHVHAAAGTAHDADVDYSSWAVDPSVPGPDLPPTGRSLFDHLITEPEGGSRVYRLPFPFSALVERIQARLSQQEYAGGTRIAIFPMGRSLQRAAAAPEFFKYPRVVLAVTGEPATHERDAGVLLKDRLYVGYVEKTATLEVISYNEAAGRFEFQFVKDYRAGAQPRVLYANRAICISCHQNHAPIFSRAIWGESNANGRVAELLRANGSDLQLSAQANIDFPDDIDKATVRANTLVTMQTVWQRGCADERDRARSQRCRAAAFAAVLQHGLSGEQDFESGAPAFQDDFVATLGKVWRERWPRGLSMAESSLPDRNPLGGATPTYGGGGLDGSAADLIAASHVPAELDPLNARPAREILGFTGALDSARLIAGWSKFFAPADFRALDAHLVRNRQHVRRTTYSAQCTAQRASPGGLPFKLQCAGDVASAQSLSLAGRFDDSGSGRVEWLSLGPAGRLRDIPFAGEGAQRAGSKIALRAAAKHDGLAPRFPDGRALERIELRFSSAAWEGKRTRPVEAQVELVVVDDFAPVRQAMDRLLARQASLFDDVPLVRASLMRALFSELGMPQRSWCCVDDQGMPAAMLDPPGVDAGAMENPQLQPFFRACAMCHLSRERFPPNFLSGNAVDVERNLRQCAPRMLIRLSAWNIPAEQRVKSPMPPATALAVLGTSSHRWAESEELAQLRAYVETLAREDGPAPDPDQLSKGGYEALPRCLPAQE